MRRPLLGIVLVLTVLVVVVTHAGGGATAPVRGVALVSLGAGPDGGELLLPTGPGAHRPPVVFLHGWRSDRPAYYRHWLRHLALRGSPVIFPAYQRAPFTDVASPLSDALVAVRRAMRRVPLRDGRFVVAGHSAGGTLAIDYAAVAAGDGMPRPATVLSVFPGHVMPGGVGLLPVDASRVAPGTRVVALAGARDRIVGERTARLIAREAVRERPTLRIVTASAADEHEDPERDRPAVRRAFWHTLDGLVATVPRRSRLAPAPGHAPRIADGPLAT